MIKSHHVPMLVQFIPLLFAQYFTFFLSFWTCQNNKLYINKCKQHNTAQSTQTLQPILLPILL